MRHRGVVAIYVVAGALTLWIMMDPEGSAHFFAAIYRGAVAFGESLWGK